MPGGPLSVRYRYSKSIFRGGIFYHRRAFEQRHVRWRRLIAWHNDLIVMERGFVEALLVRVGSDDVIDFKGELKQGSVWIWWMDWLPGG